MWEIATPLLSWHPRAGDKNRNSFHSVELGRGSPKTPLPTHILFSSWRLWDPSAAEQGASLWCRVQIQGEGPMGLQGLDGGDTWTLLGQEAPFVLGVWSSSTKVGGDLCSKRSCQTLSISEHCQPISKFLSYPCHGQFLLTAQSRCL